MNEQVDRFLRGVARAVSLVWFRDVEVVGGERLPPTGPAVIVGSHFNGLLDPVLVAYAAPRMPHFLAKAPLWRSRMLGRLLEFVGALPVHRAKEGSTKPNRATFEAAHQALVRGGSVALFPEGITHDQPRVAELRTGAARIALGARQQGAHKLQVVPVGLIYTSKSSPRSRALVRVAEPIDLDERIGDFVEPGADDGPDNAGAVRGLTAQIRSLLTEAALDYEDGDLALVASAAASIVLRPPGASRDWEPNLHEVERCTRLLVAAPAQHQLRLLDAVALYLDELSLLGLRDAHLVAGDLSPTALRGRLGRVAALAAASPAAAVGMAVNGPAVALVWAAGRLRLSVPMRGTARLLTGFVALPASWALLRWLLGRRGVPEPTLLTLAAGPGCGAVALGLLERLRALRSSRIALRRLREHAAVLPALWAARDAVIEAVVDALEVVDEGQMVKHVPARG